MTNEKNVFVDIDGEFLELMNFLKDKPIIYENLYKRLRMAGMVFMFSRKKAN